MDFGSVINSWQFVLAFYMFIGFVIYANKSKFEFQAKFIALYRTKLGIKSMKRLGEKHHKLVTWLAYFGVIIGYLGMLFILFFIFKGAFDLLFRPEAPPVMSPVIPGVKIPGTEFHLPLGYGLLSLFFVVVIHEFSHGVVAKAHKIPIKSSGFVLFGPLPGAFVEPDEKIVKKKKPLIQNSIFAAGPFSNVLSAALVILLLTFVMAPFSRAVFEPIGFTFDSLDSGHAAEAAGLVPNVNYDMVNGVEVTSIVGFIEQLEDLKPGDKISIANKDSSYEVTAGEHPTEENQGYLGVIGPRTMFENEGVGLSFYSMVIEFLYWFLILSLGLGLANLIPIGPFDGGRMFQLACFHFFGKKKGDVVFIKTSIFLLVLVLMLVFIPILKAVFM